MAINASQPNSHICRSYLPGTTQDEEQLNLIVFGLQESDFQHHYIVVAESKAIMQCEVYATQTCNKSTNSQVRVQVHYPQVRVQVRVRLKRESPSPSPSPLRSSPSPSPSPSPNPKEHLVGANPPG